MRIWITKASNTDWMIFKYFNTLECLFKFYEEVKYDIIIRKNRFYKKDLSYVLKAWENKIDYETAVYITESQYNICIYDDYLE